MPADLSITKTDGNTSVVPGTSDTYTITVTNNGPDTVTGASVSDLLPAGTIAANWAATGSSGGGSVSGPASGSGALATTVDLPLNASVTFSFTVQISPLATGTFTNTATVSPPAGVTDANPANNTATDTDILTPLQADLVITKTDGNTSVVPGTSDTYTITVTNNGPDTVTGASVSDLLPARTIAANWAATGSSGGGSVSGPASGSGALATTVDLPAGASVTFSFTSQISPSATGTFTNTATVSPPAGTTDTNPANNTATDTDTLTPQADLAITKTDGVTSVVQGGSTTYNIVVSNAGPSTAVDSVVTDLFSSAITAVSWTAVASAGSSVAQASGTGNIFTPVTLLPGGTAIFTAVAQISPLATGTFTNTATVSSPAGVTDTNPGNNAATDTDTLTLFSGVNLVKLINGQDADSPTGPHVAAGSTLTFTYVVTDASSVPLANVAVSDDKLGPITSFTGDANGNGLLDLGEIWIYTATATALAGQQTNVGTVTAQDTSTSATVSDSNPANYFGDAAGINLVKFVNGQDADIPTGPHVAAGSTVTFTYVVTDTGNVPLANVTLTDDKLGLITSFTGDANGNGLLDLTETWIYTQTATALAGQQTNVGTVTGQDATNLGTTVNDDNPANYFGDVPGIPQPTHDFNADAHSDFLWQHDSGQAAVWLMNGASLSDGGAVGPYPGPPWHVIDTGDFNGDTKIDILWQHDSGQVALWLMNGTSLVAGGAVGPNPGPSWHVIDTGDFNGDTKSDILWQNDSGQAAVWLMNGTSLIDGGAVGPNPGPSWHVIGTGDFNGDTKSDILWQNDSGQAAVWLMDGTSLVAGGAAGPNPGPSWHVIDTGDFNGDTKSDILWQNDSGQAAVWLMNGTSLVAGGAVGPNPGPSWDVIGAGDFNGDTKSDILWQNDNGQPMIWTMDGTTLTSMGVLPSPGMDWHLI